MATMVTLTCPKCKYSWAMDYERLQRDYRVVYRSAPVGQRRREEYLVRCPNHGEEIVFTLEVEE